MKDYTQCLGFFNLSLSKEMQSRSAGVFYYSPNPQIYLVLLGDISSLCKHGGQSLENERIWGMVYLNIKNAPKKKKKT